MTIYQQWIADNVPASDVYGQCAKWCERMRDVFAELELRAGYYMDVAWGPRQHWWLQAPDGSIVDPTASQFPTKGKGVYEALAEDERPIGKCMDCGSDTFRTSYDSQFCTEKCEQATRRYMGIS